MKTETCNNDGGDFDYETFFNTFDITTGKPIVHEEIDGKNGPRDGAGPNYAMDPNWSHYDFNINDRFKNAEYQKWRLRVIRKAKDKCQKCDSLNATNCHHIKNYQQYPELQHEVSNGILFCRDCHIRFHNIYGRKNNNEIQVEEFLGAD